ncbi:histone deacetylase [Estrella lausannensis]|uniref:Histone deacetylase superfamily n=1 Tax=Estrella lausannensis TaxID=483423 RepID=A0A0H5E521_9BACT|nr:histone deacetylase [Estrella lausannensis]CRX38340.1 histone deacetylase superfamily [Estrella lausannensis]
MDFKVISDSRCLKHETPLYHPESKQRFLTVERALREKGLLNISDLPTPRLAAMEDLLLCHSPQYITTLTHEIERLREGEINLLSTGDVWISPFSFLAAKAAAGSMLAAADHIMGGYCRKVFVNARPPGHHATSDAGMGFCLINNVAVAAAHLLYRHHLQRLLVIDWDVHHGNGTQDIFYRDPRVFYFSTHQEGIYPGTGLASEQGEGEGAGTTMNRPVAAGNGAFAKIQSAFQDLEEAMEKYQPQFVLISAGFDAHELDPLGGLKLKTEDFGWMTTRACLLAKRYAEGRIISVLEGGYSLDGLYSSINIHLEGLI